MAYSSAPWWNTDYTYRKCISITAPGGEAVPAGYSVELTEDTAALVTATKMLASRNDLRIVYWNGTTNTELDRHYSAAASTWFKIQAEIDAAATNTSYFLYYGNAAATAPDVDFDNVYLFGDNVESGVMTDWSTSLTLTTTLTASASGPLSGLYSMLLTPYVGWQYWWQTFTATPTDVAVRVQCKVNIDKAAQRTGQRFQFQVRSGATLICYLYAYDGSSDKFYLQTTVQWDTAAVWVDATSYVLAMDIDPATRLVDVYVDGVAKLTDKALGSVSSINQVRFAGTLLASEETDYIRVDDVIVRRLMATAPTVTSADEAQRVLDVLAAQYNCGTTNPVTDTLAAKYHVFAATITDTLAAKYDVLNALTDTLVAKYTVDEFVWDRGSHAVRMTPSTYSRVDLSPSTQAVRLTPSTYTVKALQTGE